MKQSKAKQQAAALASFHTAQAQRRVLKASKPVQGPLSINEDVIIASGIMVHPNGRRLGRRVLNREIKKGNIPERVRELQDLGKAGKL